MEEQFAHAALKDGVGRSRERIQAAAVAAVFLAILALGSWTRFQGLSEKGIFAHDSADVWRRTCARMEGVEPPGIPRFQPLPDYLYMLGMHVLGKHDYAPLAVNAAFDAANLALLFFLSRRILRNAWAALACMGLYAVMWGAVLLSRELMTHPPAVFFSMLAFWMFVRYAEEVDREEGGRPLRWLALSGFFAGLALVSHLSVQFICVAYIVLIAMKMTALGGTALWKRGWYFFVHAAVFSLAVFSVTGFFACTEMAARGSTAFLTEMRGLSNIRSSSAWLFERHYAPRVNATKIRPTITSGTLDHLTLGTEAMVNGQPAMDRLTTGWYGDNPYALAFFLNIPVMIILAGRKRKGLFPGYALYVLTLGFVFGLYFCYTCFYVHHYRYLLPVMPFLIISLFFWTLLLAREFLPRRLEVLAVLLVALAGFWGQKLTLPGNPVILEPTPCRQISNVLEGKETGSASRLLMAHPAYRFGTGELGWTLRLVYFRNGAIVPLPAAKDFSAPAEFFHDHHIRYVFTDLHGVEGLPDKEDLRGDPALCRQIKDMFANVHPREIGKVEARGLEGIVYEVNADGH